MLGLSGLGGWAHIVECTRTFSVNSDYLHSSVIYSISNSINIRLLQNRRGCSPVPEAIWGGVLVLVLVFLPVPCSLPFGRSAGVWCTSLAFGYEHKWMVMVRKITSTIQQSSYYSRSSMMLRWCSSSWFVP